MAQNGKPNKERQDFHWKWLAEIVIRPKRTLEKIAAFEKPVWLTPLLVITVLAILSVLISGPIKIQNLQSGTTPLPENFQYWSEKDQQAYFQGQQNLSSPIFIFVFPILQGVGGYWLFWLLFSSILYLISTLSGSRAPRNKAGNLTAWAMSPFILRLLVQSLTTLFTRKLVTINGLAGFIAKDAKGFQAFARGLLSQMDVYWVWFVVLIVIGMLLISGLKRGKTITAVLVTVLIMLVLQAIPSLISSTLSGLSGGGTGFYFF